MQNMKRTADLKEIKFTPLNCIFMSFTVTLVSCIIVKTGSCCRPCRGGGGGRRRASQRPRGEEICKKCTASLMCLRARFLETSIYHFSVNKGASIRGDTRGLRSCCSPEHNRARCIVLYCHHYHCPRSCCC